MSSQSLLKLNGVVLIRRVALVIFALSSSLFGRVHEVRLLILIVLLILFLVVIFLLILLFFVFEGLSWPFCRRSWSPFNRRLTGP